MAGLLFGKLGRSKAGARTQAAKPPPAPTRERAQYVRYVTALWQLWSHAVLADLDLHTRADAGECRLDAGILQASWDELFRNARLDKFLERLAGGVNKRNANYFGRILKVPPTAAPEQAAMVATWRDESVALITKLGREHVADLTQTIANATAQGVRHEDLAPVIQERLGVGLSRAKLIARDQVLKYNSDVHVAQATAAGLTEFDWSDSGDGVVRPMHHALNGKRFKYANPPVTNENGERNLPGKDIQCRCQAIPRIPLFEGI